VKQAVDHYKNIDLRSSQSSRSPQGLKSPGVQGSVHTSGSSLSKPYKLSSYLPRPVEEKNLGSFVKQKEGFGMQLGATNSSQGAHLSIQAAEVAAEPIAADVIESAEHLRPSAGEGSP